MVSRAPALLLVLVALPLLSGCLAKAALDVATAPVRVAGKAADWATTSQSEADEKRGRDIRRREEQVGRLQRSYDRNMRKCQDGEEEACYAARRDRAEMQDLVPGLPYER